MNGVHEYDSFRSVMILCFTTENVFSNFEKVVFVCLLFFIIGSVEFWFTLVVLGHKESDWMNIVMVEGFNGIRSCNFWHTHGNSVGHQVVTQWVTESESWI